MKPLNGILLDVYIFVTLKIKVPKGDKDIKVH